MTTYFGLIRQKCHKRQNCTEEQEFSLEYVTLLLPYQNEIVAQLFVRGDLDNLSMKMSGSQTVYIFCTHGRGEGRALSGKFHYFFWNPLLSS